MFDGNNPSTLISLSIIILGTFVGSELLVHILRRFRKYYPIEPEQIRSLILNTLGSEEMTGFELMKALQNSHPSLFLEMEGKLYAYLHRMEEEGIIGSRFVIRSNGKERLVSHRK